MKDFLGNELAIGDKVAFARNPYSDLYSGYVVDFTDKKIRVGKTIDDVKSPNLVFSYQCVKVYNPIIERYELGEINENFYGKIEITGNKPKELTEEEFKSGESGFILIDSEKLTKL